MNTNSLKTMFLTYLTRGTNTNFVHDMHSGFDFGTSGLPTADNLSTYWGWLNYFVYQFCINVVIYVFNQNSSCSTMHHFARFLLIKPKGKLQSPQRPQLNFLPSMMTWNQRSKLLCVKVVKYILTFICCRLSVTCIRNHCKEKQYVHITEICT